MNLVIFSGKLANVYDNVYNVRFTIAEKYKGKTQFVTFTAFNNTAEFLKKYINIGDHISVEGRIDSYRNNQGKDAISLVANSINFEGYQRRNEQKPISNTFEEIKDTNQPFLGDDTIKAEIQNAETWEDIVNVTNDLLKT